MCIRDRSIAYLKENIGKFENVNLEDIEAIDGKVCNSMTLSTMHGTPADEIEEIAAYLIKDKGLNTFVKCNPTLVGYDYAREILNKLGYKYIDFDKAQFDLSLIHISEPTRLHKVSRMPSSA